MYIESSSQTKQIFLSKQVEPLFKSSRSGGLGNIIAAVLIYLLLRNTESSVTAAYLTIAITVISAIRIVLSLNYLKNKKQVKDKLKHYLTGHLVMTLVIGILWGTLIYQQLYTTDDTLRNLILLIIFGLIAGSIATLSTWMLAYLAYMLPQSAAIFYVFLTIESVYNIHMVFAFSIFTLIMILTSVRFNKNHKNEIGLTINNKQLISDLNNEIGIRERVQLELEHNKQDLEKKVNERTQELVDINLSLEKVIDKKEKAEQDLQYLAYHDELTGLPNKNLLVDRINQSIKTASRDKQKLAILFLDLDRFKNINDSLGHTIGDTLIKQVSHRLKKTLRDHDTISRNGGDEFVVVLERLKNTNEAIHVAKKVINCLTEPFDIQSHKIHIGASVGISIFPTDGDTSLILLRNADTAMYRAKQSGGNQLQFYDKSMSNQLRDRLEIEAELHGALERDEFYMVYQPQIDCVTGRTIGFESLIRWHNDKHGTIGPDRFIPLLEETGLIYAVGEWVVSEVARFIQTHHVDGITFSINLSALQCNDLGYISYVNKVVNDTGIDASQLEFEITENLLIKDFEKTKVFLDGLHDIGCAIALDDFGTGYTSMNYLARLPIDVIKVDKSLIRNIDVNNNLQSIVKAIVTMSDSLGMKNIFEGIETIEELAVIKNLKGHIIQGYLFSKPLIENDVDDWLASDTSLRLVK